MKFIVIALLAFFISCRSGGESQLMKTNLFIHNQKTALKYKFAAIDAETNYQIKYLRYKGQPEYTKLINLEMESFRLSWNRPYDIQKDSSLTYEKYKQFCKAHGYDEETYINYIDEKK